MKGVVFIWLTATRPVASWPEPSPLVSLNQDFWAGALAWVRIHTLCFPASVLMASINSRALLESPAGAGAFIVTVDMAFLLLERANLVSLPGGIVFRRTVCKGVGIARREAYPSEKA